MADQIKKVATRESYGNALKELAEEFPDLVVLDADLAAATKTSVFRKAYPDRHIDCGIAESNMMRMMWRRKRPCARHWNMKVLCISALAAQRCR